MTSNISIKKQFSDKTFYTILSICIALIALAPFVLHVPTVQERAIVGVWRSSIENKTFVFRDNGTYQIFDYDSPFGQYLSGKYYGSTSSIKLTGAMFTLENGLDIQFNQEGTAFYISIDGNGTPENLYIRSATAKTIQEANRLSTEQLLAIARNQPDHLFATSLGDSDINRARIREYLAGDANCWQSILSGTQINEEYTITIEENGRSVNQRDVDDSIITVRFGNGSVVEMAFYQGALVGCDTDTK